MTMDKPSGSKNALLIVALVALALAVGGVVIWKVTSSDSGQLATEEMVYVCRACGAVANLSPADYARRVREQASKRSADDGPQRGAASAALCDKCGKGVLGTAAKCPKDGTVVPLMSNAGEPGTCPKCGWTPES